MHHGNMKYHVIVVLVAGLLLATTMVVTATAESGDPCGGNNICQQLLETGKQCYLRGEYREAASYFNRAVNLSPVGTAMMWYGMQIGPQQSTGHVSSDSPKISPHPPTGGTLTVGQPAETPPEEDVVVFGDDEGC